MLSDLTISLGAGLKDPKTGDVDFVVTESAGELHLYAYKHILSATSKYFDASPFL